MTLLPFVRTAGFFLAVIALVGFGGNQRLAYAETRSESRAPQDHGHDVSNNLGPSIICEVFTNINEADRVLPVLSSGDCPSEPPPPAGLCEDGLDNDADGFRDENDPNCHTDGNPTNAASYDPERSEAGALPVCWNGIDDDEDGKTDYPADPGCSSALDGDESGDNGGGGTTAQCVDGVDNDADGLVDSADPDCHTDGDAENESSYDPARDEDGQLPAQCSNGSDDDGDGLIDTADPDCHTDGDAENESSYDPARDEDGQLPAQCADGLDNDEDGLVDDADPGCSSSADTDETDPSGGGGDDDGGVGGEEAPVGGRSSSGGGGGGGVIVGLLGAITTQAGASTAEPIEYVGSCDAYLTKFLKFGSPSNDPEQVRRLQRVLRDFEGHPVEVNGVFDRATLNAVHAFQTKYAGDILTPWGINFSTGYVYLTTRKKVNEVFCNFRNQFPLTATEQAHVEAVRTRLENTPTVAPAKEEELPADLQGTIGKAESGAGSQVAGAAGAVAATSSSRKKEGPGSRLLDFIRNLFLR